MRQHQLLQTNNAYIRLTITPERVTLKTRSQEEEDDLAKHLVRLEQEFDAIPGLDRSKAWRGELRGLHERSFHMRDNTRDKAKEIRLII